MNEEDEEEEGGTDVGYDRSEREGQKSKRYKIVTEKITLGDKKWLDNLHGL